MASKRSEADPEALHDAAELERVQHVTGLPQRQEEADEVHRHMRAGASATILLAVLAMLTVCYFAELPIIVLLISILLAFILAPLADLLQRVRLPRSLAALIAVLLFLAVLYGIGQLSYNRAVAFSRDLPKYSSKIRSAVGRVRQQAQQFQKTTSSVLPEQEENGPRVTVQQSKPWTEYLSGSLGPTIEIAFAASFIPFLTYFMLSWQDHVRSATVMLFRMKHRNTAYMTLGLISGMIRSFIVGNVLVGLFIGAMSTVVFGIIHLPYFYFIGFISGFLSLVPYLGVLLAAVPPLISGIGQIHGGGVITILVTVLGLHLFALNVLYPKFLGSRLQLNPLAVTLSLLFWGWLWGAMGLVLAVPITAAIKIVFDHIETMRGYGSWLGE
ncbi:MAG: AI-2E family transporter [Acidobacteriia bacterium]|nr:AI-2E family transporter [Terriglobia bacterium]